MAEPCVDHHAETTTFSACGDVTLEMTSGAAILTEVARDDPAYHWEIAKRTLRARRTTETAKVDALQRNIDALEEERRKLDIEIDEKIKRIEELKGTNPKLAEGAEILLEQMKEEQQAIDVKVAVVKKELRAARAALGKTNAKMKQIEDQEGPFVAATKELQNLQTDEAQIRGALHELVTRLISLSDALPHKDHGDSFSIPMAQTMRTHESELLKLNKVVQAVRRASKRKQIAKKELEDARRGNFPPV